MFRRPPASFLATALLSTAVLAPAAAVAAPKDAAALKLDQAAIENDYLATKFGDAEKKLTQALALCGANNCSPKVLAQLHCDLGVVYFVGAKKTDDAKAQFAEALKADPTAAIAKALTSPEIEQVFAAAKGGAAAPVTAPAGPGPARASADEIAHTPATEQAVTTAVPIYAELPDSMNPAKVQVRYRPFGVTEWKSIDLKRLKTGYGGEIPCLDVGTTPGDLRYYIEAVDAKGEVIGTSGTRNAPYKVPIKATITSEPPHLPGEPPPAQCAGSTSSVDCPPGLAGCGEKKGDKGGGAACDDDAQCLSGSCKDAVCAAPDETPAAPSGESKANWISLSLQQDALFLPSVNDVCLHQGEYHCFTSDGVRQASDVPGTKSGTHVGGGPNFATTRVLVGYERVLADSFTVGIKAGYAFNGAPADFLPVHVEARAAYWLPIGGVPPFSRDGFRPYIVFAGGVGQIDSSVKVTQHEDTKVFELLAWRKSGPGFAALGAGISYAINPATAVFAEVKATQLFGSTGTGASLQIGFARGL